MPQGGAGSAGMPQGGTGGVGPHAPQSHRASATPCDHTRPSPDPGAPPVDAGFGGFIACRSHAECTSGANGRCSGNGHDGWQCTYDACFSDSDCTGAVGTGTQLCECEGGFRADNNVCLGGNCRVDADCGPSGYCSPTLGDCGNYTGTTGYYCHTPSDECVGDTDCGGDGGYPNPYCAFMPTIGHWRCSTSQCVG